MKFRRSSGVILHPSSLPGPDGIGDFGPEAYAWIDFLAKTGCNLWQILPLGPTGYGDSPYQCFSAFAGNPYFISPVLLLNEGLLEFADLDERPAFPTNTLDWGEAIRWKNAVLKCAYRRFNQGGLASLQTEFEKFKVAEAGWLNDFALFTAIKQACGGSSWNAWPDGYRQRDLQALTDFQITHGESILQQQFYQFLFFRQWLELRKYARQKGVQIIGDIPIFVAYDSSDVWSHPELYYLDESGLPTMVAGVPPDYFSPTGQLWGNPLYRWEIHEQTGYAWWIDRIKSTLKLYDFLRIDHFRGFAAYWEVPAGYPTAEKGSWIPGPGEKFFKAVRKALGTLPIIAEDLGIITPDVTVLREQFNLPGMKVMQFGFSNSPSHPFLPHNYPVNCVAYTGTHDNDTTAGWFSKITPAEQNFCQVYLRNTDPGQLPWDMLRALWASPAIFTLAPLQDLLCLGSEARMNFPGKSSGNWSWRFRVDDLDEIVFSKLRQLNYLYSRSVNLAESAN